MIYQFLGNFEALNVFIVWIELSSVYAARRMTGFFYDNEWGLQKKRQIKDTSIVWMIGTSALLRLFLVKVYEELRFLGMVSMAKYSEAPLVALGYRIKELLLAPPCTLLYHALETGTKA